MHLDHYDPHWSQQFADERVRLLAVLGTVIENGIIEQIQHIGATSVPAALAKPCIDIALAVWPFPLAPHRQTQVESLGYERVPGYEAAPEQRFRHVTGHFCLHIVENRREYHRRSRLGRYDRITAGAGPDQGQQSRTSLCFIRVPRRTILTWPRRQISPRLSGGYSSSLSTPEPSWRWIGRRSWGNSADTPAWNTKSST